MKSAALVFFFELAVFFGGVMLLPVLVETVSPGNGNAVRVGARIVRGLGRSRLTVKILDELIVRLIALSSGHGRFLCHPYLVHRCPESEPPDGGPDTHRASAGPNSYPHRVNRSVQRALVALLAANAGASTVGAQHQHDMSEMNATGSALVARSLARTASGTSWLPDSSAVPMIHAQVGGWSAMLHGAVFGMYDKQFTLHGGARLGLVDWEMGELSHAAAGGVFRVRAMTSVEPLVLPDTGYPELLQTGETFAGRRVANTQHPHDLLGELAAAYDLYINNKVAMSLYAAAVGEPAMGPVAFQHRPSAAPDPFTPLTHHGQDLSHMSDGVATLGFYGSRLKVEGSAFNARETMEDRREPHFDGARLDSYSGRVTATLSAWLAVSAWAGYLAHHDPLDPDGGMQGFGASVLDEARLRGHRLSTSFIWGVDNHHHGARAHDHDNPNAPTHHLLSNVLLESTLDLGSAELFGRLEYAQKTADDLGFLGGNLAEVFNVRALSAGATREIVRARQLSAAAGVRATVNVLPQTLRYTYTTTTPAGLAVFVRVRPTQ